MASTLRPRLLQRALPTPTKLTRTSAIIPPFRSHLPRPSVPVIQQATFQTTPPRNILPPVPQRIPGDVNDPAPVPGPDPAHGSYHWTAERILSLALVPFTVAPFAAGALNPLADGLFIGAILIHSHLGFQSSITDYLPKWRVPRVRKLFDWGLTLALFVVGWGWYEFETNDIGLTAMIRRVWMARREKAGAAQAAT